MHSIVGPAEKIPFDISAALWSAFYISLFSLDTNSVKHADIETRLEALMKMFPIDFFLATYNSVGKAWNTKTMTGEG